METTGEQDAPAEFIANLEEQPDEGKLIAVEVDAGRKTFTVTNARTKNESDLPAQVADHSSRYWSR